MPEDNACLFHCVNQACFSNAATVEQLKRMCARNVLSNPFYAPFLESDKESYSKAVLHPDFWGGHVEQVIFSRECGVEFVVLFSDGRDVRRVSHAATPPTKRVYLEYCGKSEGRFTHYNLFVHGPDDLPCGVFDSNDPDAELAAVLDVELKISENEENQQQEEKRLKQQEEKLRQEEEKLRQEEEYRKRLQEEKKRHENLQREQYEENLKHQQDYRKRKQEEEMLRRQEFRQRYLEDNNEQDEQEDNEQEEEVEEEKIQNPLLQHNLFNPFDRLLERSRLHGHRFDPFTDPFENFNLYPFGQRRLLASTTNLRNPFEF